MYVMYTLSWCKHHQYLCKQHLAFITTATSAVTPWWHIAHWVVSYCVLPHLLQHERQCSHQWPGLSALTNHYPPNSEDLSVLELVISRLSLGRKNGPSATVLNRKGILFQKKETWPSTSMAMASIHPLNINVPLVIVTVWVHHEEGTICLWVKVLDTSLEQ